MISRVILIRNTRYPDGFQEAPGANMARRRNNIHNLVSYVKKYRHKFVARFPRLHIV